MEWYSSAIDILRIAVIPDHRFLWWPCSLGLFLSVCPSVSVDLQRSDSDVVPLPSPCSRVLGQPALALTLIKWSVWPVQTSVVLFMLFTCFSLLLLIECDVSQEKQSLTRIHTHTHNTSWQLFSLCIVALCRSICAGNVITPNNKGAALFNWQRRKKQFHRVAFEWSINGPHPVYQIEHFYVSVSWCLFQPNQYSWSFSLDS